MNSILAGLWFFTSLLYKGQPMEKPNPALIMSFDFRDSSVDVLRYSRTDESGFCERSAVYNFDGQYLVQTVTWVNPLNNPECASDPDMQLGSESQIRVRVQQGQLQTDFTVGEDILTYVWTPPPQVP